MNAHDDLIDDYPRRVMKAEERARLRALADAATPGPWRSTWGDQDRFDANYGEETTIESIGQGPHSCVVGQAWYDGLHTSCTEENAALIAAAREAVPSLLNALEAAEAKAERYRDALEAILECESPRDMYDAAKEALANAERKETP